MVRRIEFSEECQRELAMVRSEYSLYANLGVTDREGNVVCSALPISGPVNLADRLHVAGALRRGEFTIGEVYQGRIVKRPVWSFAYPVRADDGQIIGSVYAAVDLEGLSKSLALDFAHADHLRMAFIDSRGRMLARSDRHLELLGRSASDDALVAPLLDRLVGETRFGSMDIGGIRYLVMPILQGEERVGHVVLSEPLSIVDDFFESARQELLMRAAGGFLLLLLAGWLVSRQALVRPLRQLMAVADRMGEGDLRQRAEENQLVREISHLAHGFNAMADGLQKKREDLARVHADLAEREARLRALLDALSDGVMVLNGDGRICMANPALLEMTGYEADAIMGVEIALLCPEQCSHEWLGHRGQPDLSVRKQLDMVRKDGTRFPAELALAAVNSLGEWHAVALVKDLTRQRTIEAELIQARDEAERASQAKSEFLSSMSHELRTPLNAILGFSQLLEMDLKEPQALENVGEIGKAGRHLLSLINDILDLARIEAHAMQLSLEDLRLKDVLEASHAMIKEQAERRNIRLDFETACTTRGVHADYTRLKQVLLNLLTNAIKYNREGGRVGVACADAGEGFVRISVTDTGPGISEEKQARLFQAFDRLGAEGSGVEGIGIGLVITRRLVEHMGGRMGLDSTLGEGSCFWVEFPASSGGEGGVASAAGQDMAAVGSGDAEAPRHVLYVEDNPVNMRLMEKMLGNIPSIRMLSAHTGPLGLEVLASRPVDAVLLDINLPGMSGFEVLRNIRLLPGGDRLPVIAVSANAMPSDIARGLEAGFDAYLTKPFRMSELLQTLEELLARSAADAA